MARRPAEMTLRKGRVRVARCCEANHRDVMNFRLGKRVRLGLGVGLGLQGETSGCLELSPRKKGKVRVRGRVRVARRDVGTSQTLAREKG